MTGKQGDDFLLSSFTCPNLFEAEWRRHYDVPVWQYRYFGHWDNLRLYNGSGAYHGTDLEMVFGNDDVVSGIPSSEAEDEMTRLMQHAWAMFADDPAEGLHRLGWPEYDPAEKSLIRLAYNNQPGADFVSPSEYDAPCSTVELGAYAT